MPKRSSSSAPPDAFSGGPGAEAGVLMRKAVPLIISVFILCVIAAPAAKAGPISLTMSAASSTTTLFTISGTYASDAPTFSFDGVPVSAPNGSYSITFTLNTAADSNAGFSPDAANGIFDVSVMAALSLNGGATMNFTTPFFVEFDDTAQNLGGLFLCFDGTGAACATPPQGADALATGWNIIGQQLFSGSVNHPTFIGAPNGVTIDQGTSGYFIDNGPTFTGPITNPVPEPSSIFLLGTGLLGLGFVVRRKLRLR